MSQHDEELIHFGVLGMKWGHHKANIESAVKRAATLAERKAYEKERKMFAITVDAT